MEKLISNSDSTSKKSVEKRQVWVKESFGEKKKKLRVVKKTRMINSRSMEWEWGELPFWSLLLYGACDISEDVFKVSENVLWFKKGIVFAKYSVFAKRCYWKISTRWPKKKAFKKSKTFFEMKISIETNATIATELYSRIISLVF